MNSVFWISIYVLLIVIIPNGIWVRSAFDLRTWMICSVMLLLPSCITLIRQKKIKMESVDIVLLALIMLVPISESFKANFSQVLGSLLRALLYIYLPYLAGKYLIKDEKQLIMFFCFFALAAIVLSLVAFWENYFHLSFYQELGLFSADDDEWLSGQTLYVRFDQFRVTASFSHPLFLGTFFDLVVLANILILVIYKSLASRFVTILLYVSIVLAAIATLLTQSRTSIVALGIVLVLLFMQNARKIRLILLVTFVSSLVYFLINYFFSDYLGDFIQRGFSLSSQESTTNFDFRLEMMIQSAVYLFTYLNFFGEGVINNVQLYQFVYNTDLLNGFLYAFLTKGIFYGLLILVVWIKAFKTTYLSRKYDNHARMFLFILIYLFIVNNITMLYGQNEIIFFMFIGIIFSPYLRTQRAVSPIPAV